MCFMDISDFITDVLEAQQRFGLAGIGAVTLGKSTENVSAINVCEKHVNKIILVLKRGYISKRRLFENIV